MNTKFSNQGVKQCYPQSAQMSKSSSSQIQSDRLNAQWLVMVRSDHHVENKRKINQSRSGPKIERQVFLALFDF